MGRLPRTAGARSGGGAGGLAVYPVVEHEERQPEDREGVLGAQFAVLDVDVELFGEAADGQYGELLGGRVDVSEVVAGLVRTRPPPARARGSSVAVKLACGSGKPTLTYPRPSCR